MHGSYVCLVIIATVYVGSQLLLAPYIASNDNEIHTVIYMILAS